MVATQKLYDVARFSVTLQCPCDGAMKVEVEDTFEVGRDGCPLRETPEATDVYRTVSDDTCLHLWALSDEDTLTAARERAEVECAYGEGVD